MMSLRKLPHPERGNYLGARKRCESNAACKAPIDALDKVGAWHDRAVRRDGAITADLGYAWRMLKINPFNSSNYADVPVEFLGKSFPIDGRVYQYGSALVMGLLGLVSTPYRLARKVVRVS